uniref:Retinoic acid induced 14 n=1 Tax=Neogobius melanostomus TaxID=47308 RepID=A0A8C6UED5_9GOBI
MAQKELQDERIKLLDTIEDLKQTVEHPGTESERDEYDLTASSALISALQAKINALTLENQQLKGQSQQYHNDVLQDSSRPNSLTSNSSFHSTQDELEVPPSHTDREAEEAHSQQENGGSKEEIQLLRQALESVQVKLLETRKENRTLQAQLRPERLREEDEAVRENEREAELMESLAELQAKLTDTQERYHHALEEVEELRAMTGQGDNDEKQEEQSHVRVHEHEVRQLTVQLLQTEAQKETFSQQVKHLEEALRRAENKCNGKDKEQRTTQIENLYREAKEEIRILQEALRGTVPVEAAAKDFEEMKAELNEVISGLQRRLMELSHSYSETKSQLSAAQKQLADSTSSTQTSKQQEDQTEVLKGKVVELQASLSDTEKKYSAAQQEISQLHQEAEKQLDSSVSLTDHTQVVASLGNAIKDLENQMEALKEQLHQKTQQVDALQARHTEDKTSDDTVAYAEHETMKQQLEGEVKHLTQLLQAALRKQDEMALEAADAWQQARDNRAEREALQELVMSREKENQTLSSRLAESQDAVSQLKQLVENHVASEREKNKRIDDLSREVCKLKDALNSLSQLSYNSSSPSKRQQQIQQADMMQQQIKQLQYQLAESKKQHHEIVSVYRMHLLYAVQGQMDEDVQKALKQILLMCKMPSQAKEAC